MIRQNGRQERLVDKFSFAVFCLSATASAIGYGIWGLPGILVSPIFVAVAFLSSSKSVAKFWTAALAMSVGISAFLISAAISEESDSVARIRFDEVAGNSGLPLL